MPMAYHFDPDDPDAPQPMDIDRDDGDDDAGEFIECPACGRVLHPDAAVCNHCGEWILDDSPAARRSRGWLWPVVIGLLVATILVFWAR